MYAQATLYDYWMAIYSRKWIILLVALSSVLFTLVISFYLPPIYEAKATLFFPANDVSSSYTGSSQQRIAQAPLRPIPDEKEAGVNVGALKSDDFAEEMSTKFPGKSPNFFKKNVDFVTSPQFFTDIFVRDTDPELAAAVANAYVKMYADFHAQLLKEKAARAQQALQPQLVRVERQVTSKISEISDFKRQNKVVSSAEAEQLALSQKQQLERERNDVVVELRAIRDRIGGTGGDGAVDAEQSVMPSPLIEKARRLETRVSALTERIDRIRDGTDSTVNAVSVLQRLESEKRILDELRTNIEMNLAEARMQSEVPAVDIVKVQTARPPKSPSFPIYALNAIVALVLGLAAACYMALLLEYLRRLKIERLRRNLMEDSLVRELPR